MTMPYNLIEPAIFVEHRHILIGFSGGLDSTVLLHQLVRLRPILNLQLRAIHIHHGISPKANSWLQHCQKICEQLDVPIVFQHVQLENNGQGIEAEARYARYQVFQEKLQSKEVLVTAHHLDDQCETLLLALKRGSGPMGLAAMPFRRTFGDSYHFRPLLTHSREQLEYYAQQHRLAWIEDESNQDQRFDRNFLRQAILPQLKQRWPQFAETTARSAALCGEQEALLDELLKPDLQAVITAEAALSINALSNMTSLKRAALIRRWLTRCQAPLPSRDLVQRIWSEVALSRHDASPKLKLGEGWIRRYQQHLSWVREFQGQRKTQLVWQDWSVPLVLPDQLGTLRLTDHRISTSSLPYIRRPNLDEQVSIRFTIKGKVAVVGRDRSRELKKLWQEFGVPPWWRENTPILFYNDTPICVAKLFVSQAGLGESKMGLGLKWEQL